MDPMDKGPSILSCLKKPEDTQNGRLTCNLSKEHDDKKPVDFRVAP